MGEASKGFPEVVQMEGWDATEVTIQGKDPHKNGDADLTLRERKEEKTKPHCKKDIPDLLMNKSSSDLLEEDFTLNLHLLHLY